MYEKFTKHAGIVSFGIFLSRILGFVRDFLLAHFFSKELRGVFFAAWVIPNMFRMLLGEGALSSSFIPVFVRYLKKEGKSSAWQLASIVINLLLIVSLLIVFFGIIFAPIICSIVAPGFINLGLIPSMASVLKIIFPYLILICLSAVIMGILNSLERFGPPSIAPVMLNLSFIIFILFICPCLKDPLFALSLAVLLGGVLQVLIQAPALFNEGFGYKPIINLSHPGVKEIGIKMLPGLIGFAVYQVNIAVDTICASLIGPSAVSSLYYANRLIDLPLALFGTAIGIVALPSISRSIAENDLEEAKKTLNWAARLVLVIILPVMVGFIILGKEIIGLLFEHGEFSPSETNASYLALFFYTLGLVFSCGIKPVVSFFYALGDTKTPLKVAGFCMVLNIALNLLFVKPLEEGGLALATSMSCWINLSILTIILKKRIGLVEIRLVLKTFVKSLIAGMIMGIFLIAFLKIGLSEALNVGGGIILCVFIYLLCGKVFRISEVSTLRNTFYKGRNKKV
ncbi:MAG: murein biosynthesis integral membrane protein MurJ [bacterium]